MLPECIEVEKQHENKWRQCQGDVRRLGKQSAERGNGQKVILVYRVAEIGQRGGNLNHNSRGHHYQNQAQPICQLSDRAFLQLPHCTECRRHYARERNKADHSLCGEEKICLQRFQYLISAENEQECKKVKNRRQGQKEIHHNGKCDIERDAIEIPKRKIELRGQPYGCKIECRYFLLPGELAFGHSFQLCHCAWMSP